MENLNFKGNDPGAVQHGNFINYYNFNPPDERIKLLPLNIWNSNKISYCLDIGCNSGDLTIAFSEFLKNCGCENQILAIDIDPILIDRAKEKRSHIKFVCYNIMNEEDFKSINSYLNVKNLEKFDIVTCFSITMWIHLNEGDDGLRNFLKKVSDLSELLVIEPQPWKCYKTAVKRMKKANSEFSHFNSLKYRENIVNDIENYLIKELKRTKVLETENTKWGRKLLFFK